MAGVNAEYAGYVRYLLRKSEGIRQTLQIINMYKDDLVPASGFEWGFKYSD